MAENPAPLDPVEVTESHAPYLKVWVALLVLTVGEYLWARFLAGSTTLLIAGLITMALVKAALVAYYFMHVKFEGRWVYVLMVPVLLMACIVVLSLVPDVAIAPRNP